MKQGDRSSFYNQENQDSEEENGTVKVIQQVSGGAGILPKPTGLRVQSPPHSTVLSPSADVFFPSSLPQNENWLAMCAALNFFPHFPSSFKMDLMMLWTLVVPLQILPSLVPVNLPRMRPGYFLFSMDSGTACSRKLSFVLSKSLATLKLLLWGTQPSSSWITEVHPSHLWPNSLLSVTSACFQDRDQHSQLSKPLAQGACSRCHPFGYYSVCAWHYHCSADLKTL